MSERTSTLAVCYLVCAVMLVLTVVSCVVYVQQDMFLVHYYTRAYAHTVASHPEWENWILERRVLALPVLLRRLHEDDPDACARVGKLVLRDLARYTKPTDPENSHLGLDLVSVLSEQFARLSSPGREQAIAIACALLEQHLCQWSPHVPNAIDTAGTVLARGLEDDDLNVRAFALQQTARLWNWKIVAGVSHAVIEDWRLQIYTLATHQLANTVPRLRELAALAIRGAPYHEAEETLIRLLNDEHHVVRVAALGTLAKLASNSLSKEQLAKLFVYLSDPEPHVRKDAATLLRHCEVDENIIRLATLLHHPQPEKRLRLIEAAFQVPSPGIDPVAWLLRLARDPDPQIRLAVARKAVELTDHRLHQLVSQMAESDADPQVRAQCVILTHRLRAPENSFQR